MLGESFESDGIGILEDEAVCAVLVDVAPGFCARIKVGDLTKLKPQTGKCLVGFGIVETNPAYRGSHVIIVKRGQTAVIDGKAILRLFVRVPLGTAKGIAQLVAANAYESRKTAHYSKGNAWHDRLIRK